MENGLVHAYCGDGKGKTTAAMGAALRAAGREKKVLIVRFLKTDDSGEVKALAHIPKVTVLPCQKTFGFSWNMTPEQKKEAAVYYTEQFEKACALAEDYDMLIMDEIASACSLSFIKEERLLDFLEHRPPHLEVILTGREFSSQVLSYCGYVTRMVPVRHPFEQGISAREGIEY